MSPSNFQLVEFIKDVFLDSQVTIGLLSNVTALSATPVGDRGQPGVTNRPPRDRREAERAETITAAQTAAARNFVNEISGSRRMMAHGMLYVGKGNLESLQQQIDENRPDSWKGYNISYAAKVDDDPMSLMRRWRHDDEEVAYPSFELIRDNYRRLRSQFPGFNNMNLLTSKWVKSANRHNLAVSPAHLSSSNKHRLNTLRRLLAAAEQAPLSQSGACVGGRRQRQGNTALGDPRRTRESSGYGPNRITPGGRSDLDFDPL